VCVCRSFSYSYSSVAYYTMTTKQKHSRSEGMT